MKLPVCFFHVASRQALPRAITALVALGLMLAFSLGTGTPAKADWRSDLGTFRIGIVGGDDPAGIVARSEPFRLALSEALGMEVEMFPARDYAALIDAQTSARVEYAILSAAAYSAAWASCECIEPLVTATTSLGDDRFYSVIIARQDGPSDIAGLSGRSVVHSASSAVGGFEFAKHQIAMEGVRLEEAAAELIAARTGEEAIARFADGEGDAVVGWSTLKGDLSSGYSAGSLKLLADRSNGSSSDYKIIWSSKAIPHRTHAIAKKLDGEAKRILRSVLSGLFEADPVAYDSIEPVYGGGFVAARHSQFLPMISFVKNPDARPDIPDTNSPSIAPGENNGDEGQDGSQEPVPQNTTDAQTTAGTPD